MWNRRGLLLATTLLLGCDPGSPFEPGDARVEDAAGLTVSITQRYRALTADRVFSRGDAVQLARACRANGERSYDFRSLKTLLAGFEQGQDGAVRDAGGVNALQGYVDDRTVLPVPFEVTHTDPLKVDHIRPGFLAEVNRARTSLDLAAFQVADLQLVAPLLAAAARGVRVRVVTDDTYFRAHEHQAELDERVRLKRGAVELYAALRQVKVPSPEAGARLAELAVVLEELQQQLDLRPDLFSASEQIDLTPAREYLQAARAGLKPLRAPLALVQNHLWNELRGDSTRARCRPAYEALLAAGVQVREDQSHALSHNKYLVIDAERVWTGSYNLQGHVSEAPETLGLPLTADNALVLESKALASAYAGDFAEMAEGRFHREKLGGHGGAAIDVDGVQVTPFFAPSDPIGVALAADLERLVEVRRALAPSARAPLSIRVAGFTMFYKGTERVIDALVLLRGLGADVRVVMDISNARQTGSSLWALEEGAVPVRVAAYPVMMHHKFLAVDDGPRGFVWTGSANFTRPAWEENDENALRLESPELAAEYHRIFDTLLDDLKP